VPLPQRSEVQELSHQQLATETAEADARVPASSEADHSQRAEEANQRKQRESVRDRVRRSELRIQEASVDG
jgi:hypothetical protein